MNCQLQRPHIHCRAIPVGRPTVHPPLCQHSCCVTRDGELQVKVLPGGYYVGYGTVRIATTLGSCVAVCVRDPRVGVGGLNHFLLPQGGDLGGEWGSSYATRYGVHAMEVLINEILKRGGCRSRLEFKLFGGGHVLRDLRSDIGARNVEFVQRFMHTEGYRTRAEDLGGPWSRRVLYDLVSGRVRVKRMGGDAGRRIERRDRRLLDDLSAIPQSGGVELFT